MKFKNTKSIVLIGLVCIGLFNFWAFFVVKNPAPFWGIAEDGPVMSLAQAINIDHWIFESKGDRSLSQAQYYQPGLPYQIVSWIAYRISSAELQNSFLDNFNRVISDPQKFWFGIQLITILLTFSALILIYLRAKEEGPFVLLSALLVYFVSVQSQHYGIFLFFNESFTLLFAVLFFSFVQELLSSQKSISMPKIAFIGVVTGCLYLHKMNYVVWGFAFLPALLVRHLLVGESFMHFIQRSVLFIVATISSILLFGGLVLSWQGLVLMLKAHLDIFIHSEAYGTGANSIVSKAVMTNNISLFANNDFYVLLALISFIILPSILLLIKRKNRDWLRQNLPSWILLMAAMLVTTLAIVKHYQPHYTVAIAAIFPMWVIWLSRAGTKWIMPLALPLIVYGVLTNGKTKMDYWNSEIAKIEKSFIDESNILKMQIGTDEVRLWMYRVVTPSFQRVFLANFAGLDVRLLPEIEKMQGRQWMASPWHNLISTLNGYVKMEDVNWRYLVMPKSYTNDGTVLWDQHPWIKNPAIKKIDFNELTVFENTQFKSKKDEGQK